MAAKFKYYDGSKWVTPSEVNANPTLAGTETELTGLEIDGVKYKIPVGGGSATGNGALYQHKIIVNDGTDDYDFVFLSKQSEPFVDGDSLMDFLTAIGAANDDNVIISPMIKKDGASAAEIVNGMVVNAQIYSVVITTVSGNINFAFQSNLEIFDTVSTYIAGGSGGGDTPSVTGGSSVDVIELSSTLDQILIKLRMTFLSGELEEHKADLNAGISQINTATGLSIPLMTDLDSLSDIIDYINTNVPSDTAYNQCMTGFFAWVKNYSLSNVFILPNNGNIPVMIEIISMEQGRYRIGYIASDEVSASMSGTDSMGGQVDVSGLIPSCGFWDFMSSTHNSKYTSLTIKQGTSDSGSGGAGGSGKLYEIKFDLTQYDNNGDAVEINMGLLGTYSTLTYHIQFYESNFEKIKIEFNAISQANNLGITVNTPQDFVAMINMFDDTTGSSTNSQSYSLIYYLISLADKAYFSINFSDGTNEVPMLFEIISADFFGNIYYNNYGQMHEITFVGLDQNVGEYFVGIDVNNSCTLTEYGTSASGGGSGTGTQTIHSNVVFLKFDEISSVDPDPLLIMVTRDDLDNLLSLVSTQLGITVNVENLPTVWSNASEYEKRALLYYINLIMYFGRMYYSFVVNMSFASAEVDGQTVYTAAYVNRAFTTETADSPSGSYKLNYTKVELNNIDNSTLTIDLGEQTIQGGSGSTVEAEPIISINMTNIDARRLDGEEEEIINAQFYCTKERWNNFVSLAQTYFQIEITYSNFDSVFKQLTTGVQTFAIGYLFMDYYDGKVLPKPYVYNSMNASGNEAKIGCTEFAFGTIKGQATMNNEIVDHIKWTSGAFIGNQYEVYYFPNSDRSTDPYTTADTVITVEEIAGAAIGSSASGGTNVVANPNWQHTEDLDALKAIQIGNQRYSNVTWGIIETTFDYSNDGISESFKIRQKCLFDRPYDVITEINGALSQIASLLNISVSPVTSDAAFSNTLTSVIQAAITQGNTTLVGYLFLMLAKTDTAVKSEWGLYDYDINRNWVEILDSSGHYVAPNGTIASIDSTIATILAGLTNISVSTTNIFS